MEAWREETRRIETEVLPQNLPMPIQIDKVAAIRRWFRPQDTNAWYAAIQSYLSGNSNLDETLHRVAEAIDKAISSNQSDQDLTPLWYAVIHSAKRIPYEDTDCFDKLVQLMQAFKEKDAPRLRTGEPAYQELQDWGMAAREALNDSPSPDRGCTRPEIVAWTSYNYFLARVTQAHVADMSLFGLWMLRDGLEQKYGDGSDEHREDPVTVAQKLDAFVPASAMWAIGAGRVLRDKEEDGDPKHKEQYASFDELKVGDTMWPNSARFSSERWAFWKSRFGNISGMTGVGEETRKLSCEAVKAMEALESRQLS